MSNKPDGEPDSVLTFAEADYCYGKGTLTMRVGSIGADPFAFRRLEWIRVTGWEILADGTERPREIMARVAAVKRLLSRPAGSGTEIQESHSSSRYHEE